MRTEEPDLRRRIRWAIIGTAVGLGPVTVLQVGVVFLLSSGNISAAGVRTIVALAQISNLLLVLVPISFGYAIFKYRLFDVRVVVRRGLQYLLARGVLESVLALPFVLLVATVASNPDLTVGELVSRTSIPLYLLIAGALSIKFRSQLAVWLDRKFFRDDYNRERILMRLIDDIKLHESSTEIARLVSIEVEVSMRPTKVVIANRNDQSGELTVEFSGGGTGGDFTVSGSSELVRVLEARPRATDVYDLQIPEAELGPLEDLGICLVVPMSSANGRLLGMLLLGEKRSSEPYTSRDRRLLEAIAAQMAVAFENAHLKDRVARDQRMKIEVLGRVDKEGVNLVKECPVCGLCYDSGIDRCGVDGAELTHSTPVERVVEGKYRLEKLIGRGGMGAVYEATDLRLGRSVAVKVLVGSMFGDRAALLRFEREARASARLTHPNIITVFDFGSTGSNGAFLVMELLKGTTMRAEMRNGLMAPSRVAHWCDGIFEAIGAAHAVGVVHRDLKPENVMMTDSDEAGGLVKVLDFGLAKIRLGGGVDSDSLTAPGTVMGTMGYMSPEQIAGEKVDARSDIYTIGVMIVEALTGNRPYNGRTWGELISAMTKGDYRLPGDFEAHRHLDALLARCLATDPGDRYKSVHEMRDEMLAAILRFTPVMAAGAGGHEQPTLLYGDRVITDRQEPTET